MHYCVDIVNLDGSAQSLDCNEFKSKYGNHISFRVLTPDQLRHAISSNQKADGVIVCDNSTADIQYVCSIA